MPVRSSQEGHVCLPSIQYTDKHSTPARWSVSSSAMIKATLRLIVLVYSIDKMHSQAGPHVSTDVDLIEPRLCHRSRR